MESLFSFFMISLLSLLLFANNLGARKDPGEYWNSVMKDQPMPEAIQGLISVQSTSNEKVDCHKSKNAINKVFEPRHHTTTYPADDHLKTTDEKSFVYDFEPRPSHVFMKYHDGVEPKEDKPFVKDFEPTPNIFIYKLTEEVEEKAETGTMN